MTTAADRLLPEALTDHKYNGKFKAKLTFEDRCSALALILHGTDLRLVAAAYGINRRTASHLRNNHSPHYKEVKTELKKLGLAEFKQTYITEYAVDLINRAAKDPEIQKEIAKSNKAHVETPAGEPSNRRNGKKGVHVVHPAQCKYTHRIEIDFREADPVTESPEGWYHRDLDGPNPDLWAHCGEASLSSSGAALKYAIEEAMDA